MCCAVVFGHVVSGEEIVRKIEKSGSQSGKTSKSVLISACGVMGGSGGGSEEGESPKKKKKKKKPVGDFFDGSGSMP